MDSLVIIVWKELDKTCAITFFALNFPILLDLNYLSFKNHYVVWPEGGHWNCLQDIA